jgi:hypothetical protein
LIAKREIVNQKIAEEAPADASVDIHQTMNYRNLKRLNLRLSNIEEEMNKLDPDDKIIGTQTID